VLGKVDTNFGFLCRFVFELLAAFKLKKTLFKGKRRSPAYGRPGGVTRIVMNTLNLSVTISCHHFRKKIVTRSQILWQKYTRFNFSWSSAPNPFDEDYDAPPNPLVGWGGGAPPPQPTPPSTPTAPRSHVRVPPLVFPQFKHLLRARTGPTDGRPHMKYASAVANYNSHGNN